MQSSIDLLGVKRPYILILVSDEDKLGGVVKMIQRDTTLCLMKIFQFQCLLDQNRLLIEVRKSGQNSSVGSRPNKFWIGQLGFKVYKRVLDIMAWLERGRTASECRQQENCFNLADLV